jgi:hypothetical protein
MSDVNVLRSVLDTFRHQYSRCRELPPILQGYVGYCLAEYAGDLIMTAKADASGVAIACETCDSSPLYGIDDLPVENQLDEILIESYIDVGPKGDEVMIEVWEDPSGHQFYRSFVRSDNPNLE